jgi:hypothetical protein
MDTYKDATAVEAAMVQYTWCEKQAIDAAFDEPVNWWDPQAYGYGVQPTGTAGDGAVFDKCMKTPMDAAAIAAAKAELDRIAAAAKRQHDCQVEAHDYVWSYGPAKQPELVKVEEWIKEYGEPTYGSDMFKVWVKEKDKWEQTKADAEKGAFDRCMSRPVDQPLKPLSPSVTPAGSTVIKGAATAPPLTGAKN